MIIAENNPKLNPQQQAAVEHPGGPLLIAAGAGSGKTRTLTSRLLHLIASGVPPEQIVAITFTNKAAQEMQKRLANSGWPMANNHKPAGISQLPFIGTFHSFGARILKEEANHWQRTAAYTIFDNEDSLRLLKQICKEADIDSDRYNPSFLQAIISKAKDELWEELREPIPNHIFEQYETALAANNAFDFDDLIQKVVLLFTDQPEILARYQKKWQHILVDEFQDVNTSQYRLVRLLADRHQNLWVVGDDFQSIFAFRGADFRNFLNFENDWPKARVVLLEENYRSDSNIIEAANAVIQHNKRQKPKTIWTKNPAGAPVKVTATGDENEEAEIVVEQIVGLMRAGDPLEEMAVLYRTNAQSRAIEQQCIVRSLPYSIFGGLKFYERKEIKDIIAALRLVHNPKDTVSLERLQKLLPKKSGSIFAVLPTMAKNKSLVEIIQCFLTATDYLNLLEKNFKNHLEREENVKELIIFASGFAGGLGSFLEQVSLAGGADTPSNKQQRKKTRQGINLMSIHLAKGLEFKNVFVIGCAEGLLPHQRSFQERSGIEEERRLMYVAMTRAQKNLYLSFAGLPSRFLYEIPPQLVNFVAPSTTRKILSLDEDERDIAYD